MFQSFNGGLEEAIVKSLFHDWKILWEQSCIHNDAEIYVSKDAEIIKGKYLGVNDLGELLLQNEKDEVISFSSGEVSIKGIYNK